MELTENEKKLVEALRKVAIHGNGAEVCIIKEGMYKVIELKKVLSSDKWAFGKN